MLIAKRPDFKLVQTFLTFGLIVLVATGMRVLVDGNSMSPTLHNQQTVMASRLPAILGTFQRGDIVVLREPANEDTLYIKRIVGLPGDTIQIHNGGVWVNGETLEEPYLVQPIQYQGRWELGTNEYFVLGDNRNNSLDSHVWGPIDGELLVGKAVIGLPTSDGQPLNTDDPLVASDVAMKLSHTMSSLLAPSQLQHLMHTLELPPKITGGLDDPSNPLRICFTKSTCLQFNPN